MMALQAVVFDVGDVLFHWEPEKLYRRLIADAEDRKRFLAEICSPEWNAGFDRGAAMPEGVARHAERHPAHAELIRAWWSRWPEMTGPAIEGSIACLRALKAKGLPVFGLTNFAAETWPIAQTLYPVLTEFDDVVVSGREGRIKPEPEIYALLESRVPVAPEALFFTDDRPANVAAARARGWTAHLFRGAHGLRQALIEAALLKPHEAPVLDPV
jgi:2-haloacid dehalogenase